MLSRLHILLVYKIYLEVCFDATLIVYLFDFCVSHENKASICDQIGISMLILRNVKIYLSEKDMAN